jgi:hypothetical protein
MYYQCFGVPLFVPFQGVETTLWFDTYSTGLEIPSYIRICEQKIRFLKKYFVDRAS